MGPRVGPLALATIKHFESCKLKAYRCSAGIPTIGWGMTTYGDGRPVQMGDTITRAEADIGFARLVNDFAAKVATLIGDRPTTPAQFGALVSLGYNMGVGKPNDPKRKGLRYTTAFRAHLEGNHAAAADAFLPINKARNPKTGQLEEVAGLTRRRKAERALYLSDFAELARLTNDEVQA